MDFPPRARNFLTKGTLFLAATIFPAATDRFEKRYRRLLIAITVAKMRKLESPISQGGKIIRDAIISFSFPFLKETLDPGTFHENSLHA